MANPIRLHAFVNGCFLYCTVSADVNNDYSKTIAVQAFRLSLQGSANLFKTSSTNQQVDPASQLCSRISIDDVRPWDTLWNYSFLFAEADAYLDSPARQTVYAEVRQGLNYRLADNLIVSPFLIGDVKWWIDSPDDVSFYEGGAGLSLRYAFDETKYVLPRRSLELLLTYKVGRVFDTDNIREDDINALFATLIFRF